MTELARRITFASVVVAFSLAVPGCTNSDPLAPQPGQVQVVVKVDPAGAAGFDSFVLVLRQIGVDAIRTGSDTVLGASPFGSLSTQVTFNLASGGERVLGSMSLPVGRYQVTSLDIDHSVNPPMFLRSVPVQPSDPCSPSNCRDYVAYKTGTPVDPNDPFGERFNGKLPTPEISGLASYIAPAYRISPMPGAPVFEVLEGVGTVVTLDIDGAALAQEFLNAYACSCSAPCIVDGRSYTAPCLPSYTKPTQEALLSHVAIE
jgi:hypothetical protein